MDFDIRSERSYDSSGRSREPESRICRECAFQCRGIREHTPETRGIRMSPSIDSEELQAYRRTARAVEAEKRRREALRCSNHPRPERQHRGQPQRARHADRHQVLLPSHAEEDQFQAQKQA